MLASNASQSIHQLGADFICLALLALLSAWSHSVGDTNKVNATLTVLMELDSMGMPKTLARQAIKRLAYKTDSGLWPTEVETRYLAHAGGGSC